jgi:hypothetical protein
MNRLKLLSIITLFCITVQASHAQVMASWNFAGLSGGGVSPMVPTSSNGNVTVVGLTRGAGLLPPALPVASGWGSSGYTDEVATASQTAATAASNDNYVYFSITPNTGFSASLSSISPYNVRKANFGPGNLLWQYSIDGINFTDIGTAFLVGGSANANGSDKPQINLSGIAALQNIAPGTTVTFRLLAWTAAADAGDFHFNGAGQTVANRSFTINGTTTLSVPLPLQLISFNGKQQQNSNHLEWVTAQEKNVSFFELERGTDGRTFNKIATINAKGNDNNGDNQYSYDDENVTATTYYRLRMVDRDGKVMQSNIVFLSKDATGTAIRVYPNPSESVLFIEGLNLHSSYRILDVTGKEVLATSTVTGDNNIASINVRRLTQGNYFIQISGNNNNETIRFIKK